MSSESMRYVGNRSGARRACFVMVLFTLVASGCGGAGSAANGVGGPVAASVNSTITVGGSPEAIAVDISANQIYVANRGPGQSGGVCSPTGMNVTDIDGAIGSASTIGVNPPLYPHGSMSPRAIAADPASHTVYLAAWGMVEGWGGGCYSLQGHLFTINGTTAAAPGPTAIAFSFPGGIAVNSLTKELYLGINEDWGKVHNITVFDLSSNTVMATIPVVSGAIALALNSTTNRIYAIVEGSISVIDGVTHSISQVIDLSPAVPTAIAVDPATNEIYVVSTQSNNVTVIDGATGSVTATIEVGTSPVGVAVDSQTNFIYVANAGNSQTGDPGNISVIDGVKHSATTLTDPNAKNPVAIAVNPLTNKIYVANSRSNNVTVIDGAH